MMPSRSGPDTGSLPRLAISLMPAACSITDCAWRTISSPSGVTLTSLLPRSNSFTSSSSSSFLIATLKVGCETKQASAARPKWRSRATATMYRSSVSVTRVLLFAGGEIQRDAGGHHQQPRAHRPAELRAVIRTAHIVDARPEHVEAGDAEHERHVRIERRPECRLILGAIAQQEEAGGDEVHEGPEHRRRVS